MDKKKREQMAQDKPNKGAVPIEEQMARRQSAPRPTAQQELQRMGTMRSPNTAAPNGAVDGFAVLEEVIGREEIQAAQQTLQRYKEGKANLERKVIENVQWYKLRHWDYMESKKKNQVEPVSAWLFNSLANKMADAMDNAPRCNVLPRESGDRQTAETLSAIIPVILAQNDFEECYDDEITSKLIEGTGVYGVFWDKDKNGIGDISIVECSILSVFWEPGVKDIQKSRNFYHVELMDNDLLLGAYPQLQGKLGASTMDLSKYVYDDTIDTSSKSAVVDWYYKKSQNGRTVLHYCKYVNDVVLFATENEPDNYPNGWFDHGLYPYVFDPLFKIKDSPCGFGYVDVGRSPQEYIDRGNQAIMQNMLANAKPRHFVRSDGSVNEEEYADLTKDFIHVDGNLGQDSILPVQGKPLNEIYVSVLNDKVGELKEVTGNRDVSTGGTTGGVTSASGIASMQEAGSKLSRRDNKSSFRAFRRVCLMVIELIRQFYDLPRIFRVVGENGMQRYEKFSNAGMKPQHQGSAFGVDFGYRVPLFDVEVEVEKRSAYSRVSQNELALQFYSAGFFNPQMADQALAALDMMDFDRKQFIMQKIAQNGTMYQQMMMMQQQMLQLAQIVDRDHGSNIAQQMATGIAGQPVPASAGGEPAANTSDESKALGGNAHTGEHPVAEKARRRVAESTDPT